MSVEHSVFTFWFGPEMNANRVQNRSIAHSVDCLPIRKSAEGH